MVTLFRSPVVCLELSHPMEILTEDVLQHICSFLGLDERQAFQQTNKRHRQVVSRLSVPYRQVRTIQDMSHRVIACQRILQLTNHHPEVKAILEQKLGFPLKALPMFIDRRLHPWGIALFGFQLTDAEIAEFAPLLLQHSLTIAVVDSEVNDDLIRVLPHVFLSATIRDSRVTTSLLLRCPVVVKLVRCDLTAVPPSFWKSMRRTCAFRFQDVRIRDGNKLTGVLWYDNGKLTRASRSYWTGPTEMDFLFTQAANLDVDYSKLAEPLEVHGSTLVLSHCHIQVRSTSVRWIQVHKCSPDVLSSTATPNVELIRASYSEFPLQGYQWLQKLDLEWCTFSPENAVARNPNLRCVNDFMTTLYMGADNPLFDPDCHYTMKNRFHCATDLFDDWYFGTSPL